MKKFVIMTFLLFTLLSLLLFSGCKREPAEEAVSTQELCDELLEELTDYLQSGDEEVESVNYTFGEILERIKSYEANLFDVEFLPEKYYFACAYHTTEHRKESKKYCCAEDYTWIGFKTPQEIKKYSGELKLVAAFQINKRDAKPFTSSGHYPHLHFTPYDPQFENGINISPAAVFNERVLYVKDDRYFQDDNIVFSKYYKKYDKYNIPYADLNGTRYITQPLRVEAPDGSIIKSYDLKEEFGSFYDDAMAIMITDNYSETDSNGNTVHYGLFRFEDIRKTAKRNEAFCAHNVEEKFLSYQELSERLATTFYMENFSNAKLVNIDNNDEFIFKKYCIKGVATKWRIYDIYREEIMKNYLTINVEFSLKDIDSYIILGVNTLEDFEAKLKSESLTYDIKPYDSDWQEDYNSVPERADYVEENYFLKLGDEYLGEISIILSPDDADEMERVLADILSYIPNNISELPLLDDLYK